MARKQQDQGTRFIVEYEDGRTASITIDRSTLRSGDHVARIVAGERQRGGEIPDGEIKSVRRAPGQGRGVPTG